MKTSITTVFGSTGVVGTTLIELLAQQQPEMCIEAVTRSTSSSRLSSLNIPNVKLVQGEATNLEQVMSITEHSDLILCCVGFEKYEAKYWGQTWPPLVDNLLEATRGGTKRLVFCDNLYAYGAGQVISPHAKTVEPGLGSKMAIRSLLRSKFQKHMQKHPGSVVVVGAADFFGPHCTNSLLGDPFTGKIVADQSPISFGNKIHDFGYVPDLAQAMIRLSTEPAAYDKFWIAPHTVHGKTMQQIADDVSAAANKKPRKLSIISPWLVRALSPFWGVMNSMRDMLGIWTQDYVVDDSDIEREFGLKATPYDEAIKKTVDYFVARAAKK
jgi:nucleoside-diphosphate-sugar epimerase